MSSVFGGPCGRKRVRPIPLHIMFGSTKRCMLRGANPRNRTKQAPERFTCADWTVTTKKMRTTEQGASKPTAQQSPHHTASNKIKHMSSPTKHSPAKQPTPKSSPVKQRDVDSSSSSSNRSRKASSSPSPSSTPAKRARSMSVSPKSSSYSSHQSPSSSSSSRASSKRVNPSSGSHSRSQSQVRSSHNVNDRSGSSAKSGTPTKFFKSSQATTAKNSHNGSGSNRSVRRSRSTSTSPKSGSNRSNSSSGSPKHKGKRSNHSPASSSNKSRSSTPTSKRRLTLEAAPVLSARRSSSGSGSSSTSSSSSPKCTTISPPPRHTRRQAAASLAVDEELETQELMRIERDVNRATSPHWLAPIATPSSSSSSSTLSSRSPTARSLSPSLSQSPIPCSLHPVPTLPILALRRLALSGVNRVESLSIDWVVKRASKYLCLELGREHATCVQANGSREFMEKAKDMGTINNGKIYVAVSSQSDHHLHLSTDEHSKWIELPGDDEMKDVPVRPMLGLFSSVALQTGEYVTGYGGLLEWGESAKSRPRMANSHVRRIMDSSMVWDGRPYSLLFPRTPTIMTQQMNLDRTQRMRIRPAVNSRTMINLLLQLHHEQQTHSTHSHRSNSTTSSHPSSPGSPSAASTSSSSSSSSEEVQQDEPAPECRADCQLCQNEIRLLYGGGSCLNGSDSSCSLEALSEADRLATLLPSCGCCGAQLGLLPCEFYRLYQSWHPLAQRRTKELLGEVRSAIEDGGMGYMANTDVKARQNVKVITVSQFNKELAGMRPMIHIYVASRPIAAGEELFVAYNNNESKKM